MTDDTLPEDVEPNEDFFPPAGVPERFRGEGYTIGSGGRVWCDETAQVVWPPAESERN